jgi:hypothetical protein
MKNFLYQVIKRITLIAVLSFNLILTACGGGNGGAGSGTAANYFSINSTTYTENGSTVLVRGYLNQTSPNTYKLGGPVGSVYMHDANSGNAHSLKL